ncbi:MAG: hypothetical protein MUF81_16385 [Verrucomicrobia bacterium]|jgi:hypothetical protein|nr:hypothetical protein [Verrucomicrobiota bacterium]
MKPKHFLVTVLAAAILSACAKKEDAPSPAPSPTTVNATNPPAPAANPSPGFEKLKGKWLRPDGGYILEIRTATAEGKLEAGYFNPRPINVAKAEASQEGATVKVFIELRDVNYPGSTYTLVYQPAADRLVGNYFQAAMGQNFEVEFVRQQ